MADLVVTAANVVKGAGAVTATGIAGESITQGEAVYKKAADNEYYSTTAFTAAEAVFAGIALCAAASDQPIVIQTEGSIDIGATVTVGTVYCLSEAGGGICPNADLIASDYCTMVGVGTAADTIKLSPIVTGAAKA